MTELPSLTGAQKTQLRGLGQTAADAAWLGKDGVTPAFLQEFNRQLDQLELVKLRFTGGQDRKIRATLTTQVEQASSALCVGSVGHTALFYRPQADEAKRRISFT